MGIVGKRKDVAQGVTPIAENRWGFKFIQTRICKATVPFTHIHEVQADGVDSEAKRKTRRTASGVLRV